MSEVCKIGNQTVLHSEGSGFVTVAGLRHSEQLDLDGWKSRLKLYRKLGAREGGQFAPFYTDKIKACEAAIKVLS